MTTVLQMIKTMAKKDETKRTQPRMVEYKREVAGGTLLSQQKASAKWEAENPQDRIGLRVPAGGKEKIESYVAQKAKEEPDNRKYSTSKGRPSVNAFINALIEEAIGEPLG